MIHPASDTDECNALVCANVKIVGDDETPDIPVVMTHFLRPVEGGSQLQSMSGSDIRLSMARL